MDKVDEKGNVVVQNTLGVSSGQVFDGEDLAAKQREKLQKYQFKTEMEEKARIEQMKRATYQEKKLADERNQLAINQMLIDQDRRAEAARRQ